MSYFGFSSHAQFVPQLLKQRPLREINAVVIALFNANFPEFALEESLANCANLREIFALKLENLKNNKNVALYQNLQQNNHAQISTNLENLEQNYAKFSQFLSNNELIFDANELFKGYIYSRVSSVNSHRNVSEDQFGVYLKAQDFKICIVGRFERFTQQILDGKYDSYFKFKADFGPLREYDALYFAYPRQEGLKKFINFDTYALNSQKSVKIVPYLVTNQFLRRKQCQ